ncbi:MAG TPA: SUMF1/EgtB/PvdO family nonheme iron enzyme [Bryobacteraceae bacterium]|nr:SUMF1/EgtB/PvdO family nonheme iron enzyme [Bryobacteraceae bacterium]
MRLCALLLATALGAGGQTPQPPRYALLIGNTHYGHLPPLPSSKLNLISMQAALRAAGFEVTTAENVTFQSLLGDVERKFLSKITEGAICMIYYSGYAIQSAPDNYVLPVDFDPGSSESLARRARSLTGLQQNLDDLKAGAKIFVLEVAPEPASLLAVATGRGLTSPDLSETNEIIYAFSSSPNQQAIATPPDKVATFTSSLSQILQKPGSRLREVFFEVQTEVSKASGMQQQPLFVPKITRDFYFVDPPAPKPIAPPKPITISQGPSNLPRINRRDRQEYVSISAGKFLLGCVPTDSECEKAEKPQHEVTLTKPVWMGVTEVTIDAYERFVNANSKTNRMPKGPPWDKRWLAKNRPIVNVRWDEAAAFCKWAGGRLPTEAEWEHAARDGKQDQIYPLNDRDSREKANFFGRAGNDIYDDATAPVKSFDPLPNFRLYDMAGNVWEYCSDWFSETSYEDAPAADPAGIPMGKGHVIRGGSFYSDAKKHLRISVRQQENGGGTIVGFRCVLDAAETKGLFVE